MASSSGRGVILNSHPPANPHRRFGATLRPRPDLLGTSGSAAIFNDYWWGTGVVSPPAPVEIPYGWLAGFQPLRIRPDKPLTTAAVSVDGGGTASAEDGASLAAFGDTAFSATLHTATPTDAAALAAWAVAYYATDPDDVPRARFPALLIRLTGRTQPEMHRVLSVGIGTRITITGAPATWPEGATEQVVEGIRHTLSDARDVEWTTAPVVGSAPGVAGPWFRLGESLLDGDDALLF